MKRMLLLALTGALLAGTAQAQSEAGHEPGAAPIAETESMKSKNGFAGSLLVTPDEDWEKKWNTPSDTRPNFNVAEQIAYGKKVFALIFFANPKLSPAGKANVRCDLKITSPTGKVDLFNKDMTCFSGALGAANNLYLSAPVASFSGDAGDPAGVWSVDVALRDTVRGVQLQLHRTFELKKQ
jgi:hypothetical protein